MESNCKRSWSESITLEKMIILRTKLFLSFQIPLDLWMLRLDQSSIIQSWRGQLISLCSSISENHKVNLYSQLIMRTLRSQGLGFTHIHSRNYQRISMCSKRAFSSHVLIRKLELWLATKSAMIGLQTKYGNSTSPKEKVKAFTKLDQCIRLPLRSIINTIHQLLSSRITWSTSIWIQISLLFPLLALIPVSFKSISSMESVERLYINSKRLA